MGSWAVETVVIGNIDRLPNSDTLSITHVYGDGGYPCIFKTGEFNTGDLATYVAVDSLVPVSDDRFKFLDSGKGRTHERVRAKKLRGVYSQGLIVPHVTGSVEGEDVADKLGVLKYLPPAEREYQPGPNAKSRQARRSETAAFEYRLWLLCGGLSLMIGAAEWSAWAILSTAAIVCATYVAIRYNRHISKLPKYATYDVESIRKWSSVLYHGEDVVLTEKIHGANASYLHNGRKFFMKSRTTFRGSSGGKGGWAGTGEFSFDDAWKSVAKKYDLERKLKTTPNLVLFGELYGSKIQDLTYSCEPGEQRFAAFDVWDLKAERWFDHDEFREFCKRLDIPVCIELYRGPWSDTLIGMAEGKSKMPGANHVREGFVVKPINERRHPNLGRVQLKLAGEGYHLRKGQADE